MDVLNKGNQFVRIILFLATLAFAWLAWSGLFKPLLLALGAVSCYLTFVLARRMGYLDKLILSPELLIKVPGYWLWLGGEILKSSVDVARIVLDPKLPLSPQEIELKVTDENPLSQVILANSITLTPGTLTLDLHEGIIKVHCLTEQGARDLLDNEMIRRVTKLRRN
ncbi:MAG: multicomponent Na+:H+ antiporter subunit E [Gammaproteobacteria bacterium]|jgi:multicomponent Na+:H+ antiporter subunit E